VSLQPPPPPPPPAALSATFCGRCGTPAPPGAPYCGRCGASLAAAVPAYASYTYPTTSPAAPHARSGRLGHKGLLGIGGVVLVVLVVIGVIIARQVGVTPPKCRFDCDARIGAPIHDVHTYQSSQYGFQVDYTDSMVLADNNGDHVTFDESLKDGRVIAEVTFAGQQASKSPDEMINDVVGGFSSSQYQDVQQALPINGAHIGGVPATGRIYDANLFTQGGQSEHVRIAVVAAVQGNTGVVVTAVEAFNKSPNDHSGIADPSNLDYMLAEFRWTANG
jgi:hypothetical protein